MELENLVLKFIQKWKGLRILKKLMKRKVEGLALPYIQTS